jgi:hypothetical protein
MDDLMNDLEDVRHAIQAAAAAGNYVLADNLSIAHNLSICLHCTKVLSAQLNMSTWCSLWDLGINSYGYVCWSCAACVVRTPENRILGFGLDSAKFPVK